MLLCEIGISYSFVQPCEAPLMKFGFERTHISTQCTIQGAVYCYNRQDALVLINYWNRLAGWKYFLLPG